MKIMYVARHGPYDNQDEDAISYALRQLGHEVQCCAEPAAHTITDHDRYDFALFHKFEDLELIKDRWPKDKPRCFWYFDLIESDDWDLKARSAARVRWMDQAEELFPVGFMTDGDWVARNPDKWVHLLQGADERVIGAGKRGPHHYKLMFTGTTIHGGKRKEHVQELQARYGKDFRVVGDRRQPRYHGRQLADIIGMTRIMIAPDAPVTDRYWSNRVYLTLGFAGFLLHPFSGELSKQFTHGEEIIFYRDRKDLIDLIDFYNTADPDITRQRIQCGLCGLERVKQEHLYRHRCQVLVQEMQRRFAHVWGTSTDRGSGILEEAAQQCSKEGPATSSDLPL